MSGVGSVYKHGDVAKTSRRVVRYALVTAVIQGLFGLMLWGTMYGRGPLCLLFLIVMANVAYPWLMRQALSVSLWPYAIFFGTVFMFFIILLIGETKHWFCTRKERINHERKES